MNKIVTLLLLTITHILHAQNVKPKGLLSCQIDIEPKVFIKNNLVKLNFSLKNESCSELKIARSIVGNKLIWFRLRITDAKGREIVSGMGDRFIDTDDLPAVLISKLQPNEKINITENLIIDSGFGMSSYKLKPGKYFISGTATGPKCRTEG